MLSLLLSNIYGKTNYWFLRRQQVGETVCELGLGQNEKRVHYYGRNHHYFCNFSPCTFCLQETQNIYIVFANCNYAMNWELLVL